MLKAELKAIGGKHDGQIIPLGTKKFLIGRERDCHLRPNSDAVSRHHCVIVMDEYTVRVRDLGSTNGTFVNGERIQGQVILKSGDRIEIGDLTFEVLIHGQAEVAQPAAAGQPTIAPDLQVPDEKAGTRTLTEIPVPDTLSPATQDTTALSGETTVIQPPQPTVPQGQQTIESPTPPPATPTPPPTTQAPPPTAAAPPEATPTTPAAGQRAQPAVDPQLLQQQLQQLIQQQMAQQAGQPAGSAPPKVAVDLPPIRLPDPEETGVKEPPPEQKAEKAKEEEGGDAQADPTHVAAEIIRKYMRRRT